MENFKKYSFSMEEKNVDIFLPTMDDAPIVYYNSFTKDSDILYTLLKEEIKKEFSFVHISNLNWNKDMTPWRSEPIFKNGEIFLGGSDEYLDILLTKIAPEVEKICGRNSSFRVLSGYSLSGLFALYSVFKTDYFSRIGCFSPSLWYPKAKEYVFNNEIKAKLDYVYFSIGEKESITKNPYLKTTQNNILEISKYLSEKGIKTSFILEKGNHHDNVNERILNGIKSLINTPF